MKRKNTEDMLQSAVRLPRRLHERLKKAGGERGMGEEIRRRLEASFEAEKETSNPEMGELLDAISYFGADITNWFGNCFKDAFAFQVLKASVNMILTRYQPEGDQVPKPHPTDLGDLLFRDNPSPDEVSQLIVGIWLSDREKRKFADRQKG